MFTLFVHGLRPFHISSSRGSNRRRCEATPQRPSMLTREQIAAFKRDGTLVLENFAPESQLDTWVSWIQRTNV